ncbi:YihY/virulence factor BrkB family protein [Streptomyces sp. LD120]|uniref:YihY/virulence factor BrkB family protein n=1 Tax=Streptomyces physcomitrii TaxID=2724184 RepID=A0ABX1GXK2_9ACTN|nr:YihY/virulence factor BrkB family protein [Streptomyces physcomitrii]
MDWLKNLPVVGPGFTRLMRTHPWRAYERLDEVKWSQLAAAMTFISFLALFPLLTLGAAVAAATLSDSRRQDLQDKLAEQVPGISDELDISALVDNAGTVGLIAGALLLFTGIGWVGSMRECLRAVWELPEPEENPVLRKAKDAGILAGLGGAGLASMVVSTLASITVGWTSRQLGIEEGGFGGVLLQLAAFAVAVLADFLILLYVLTLLPGAEPHRRPLVVAALIGALGFELLKLLLGGYISGVAGKSMYGTFGVPVALLLWINFTAKLLLFCAAWTATSPEAEADRVKWDEPGPVAGPEEGAAAGGATAVTGTDTSGTGTAAAPGEAYGGGGSPVGGSPGAGGDPAAGEARDAGAGGAAAGDADGAGVRDEDGGGPGRGAASGG